jgi:hypothetical protein
MILLAESEINTSLLLICIPLPLLEYPEKTSSYLVSKIEEETVLLTKAIGALIYSNTMKSVPGAAAFYSL